MYNGAVRDDHTQNVEIQQRPEGSESWKHEEEEWPRQKSRYKGPKGENFVLSAEGAPGLGVRGSLTNLLLPCFFGWPSLLSHQLLQRQ